MSPPTEHPVIIIRKKSHHGGHHGGAWKVAYADFVTAMMAFFLLMWLINTTSPEQKKGIADYFAPASVSPSTSGSGGILGGTALGDDGVKSDGSVSVIEQMAPDAPETTQRGDSANADLPTSRPLLSANMGASDTPSNAILSSSAPLLVTTAVRSGE